MSALVDPKPTRPARPLIVERRDLTTATDRNRLRPKPDAAAELHEVASTMTHLPRDCFRDPAELVTLMRRLAGRLVKVADTGLEVAPSHAAMAARQPFMPRARVDQRTVADAVFGRGARARGDQAATVVSRKGRMVRVEVRRARASGQMELGV